MPTADLPAAEAALTAAGPLTVRSLLLGSGPRFAGDAFGPVLAFYVGWKVAGTAVGIGVATAVGILAWYAARRRQRPGAVALLALGFVFVQAGVGLAFDSARVYLAQQVLLSAGLGVAFLVSIALRRPLAGLFAQDIFPFPDEVRSSATFRRVFTWISLAWGVYQVLRSVVRLGALSRGSIDSFLVVNLVTGGPFIVALMAWSIWYAVRAFRRSDEWGWVLRGEEPPPEVVAADGSPPAEQAAAGERAEGDGRDTLAAG
jgi:intracellular septation protein A